MRKKPDRSFPIEGKEPVINRVFQLVDRYPSRSEAARAWGMNVSTLQNYYKRRDICPTPRKAQLMKIAEQEQVSLDWLLTGVGKELEPLSEKNEKSGVSVPRASEGVDERILELLSFLSEDEKEKILEVLVRKGIETILYLLDEDNIRLLKLDRVMKEKILGIQPRTPEEVARADDEARVCDADNSRETHPASVASTKRHAS